MPGNRASKDQLQVICHRYYFASQFVANKYVLEICCGPGFGLGYLLTKAERVVAGDITENSLRSAREYYAAKVELLRMDAHTLPFRDQCFDVVICLAAIIYLNVPSFIEECHRVLRKGGVLILNTPNKDITGFRASGLSRKYYSVPELSALLSQHNFEARFSGSFPIPSPRETGSGSKLLAALKLRVAKVLNACAFMPGVTGLLAFLRKAAGVSFVLPEEITPGDIRKVENIELTPLSNTLPNTRYRIIYIEAYAN